ncbi:MAG: ATP-binding protein [Rhodopseudomonas palustris]|nr:ATP-binding protein [Rhodopseudomonas palustris]
MPALIGGGLRAAARRDVSLAHHGVLFLDELPEFQPQRAGGAAPAAGGRRRSTIARADAASPIRRASCWWRR